MLRYLILFGFLFLPGLLIAQPYKPLLKKGGHWLEHVYSMMGPGYDSTYSIFQQDTTVYSLASHPYRKYEVVTDSIYNASKVMSAAYLYDDSVNRKVYVYTSGIEKLVYDFSKQTGDTIKNIVCNGSTTWLIVDSIQTGNYYGIQRRMFYVSDTTINPAMSVLWIEGIGSVRGLFHPAQHCLPTDPQYGLNCVHLNSTLLFGSNCNFISTGLEQSNLKPIIQLECNPPVSGILRLLHAPDLKLFWKLYDLSGRLLRGGHQDAIGISDLASGIYILRVGSGSFTSSMKVSW